MSAINQIKKKEESTATPTNSMVSTMIVIFWYYVARYIFCDRYSVRQYGKTIAPILGFITVAVILFQQFSTNLAATGDKCSGDVQIYNAIKYTLVPNLFFGLTIFVLLNKFPSWKAPFSNTLGYLFASIFGIRSTFNSMLRPSLNEGNDVINKIYNDPSMLINELRPDAPTTIRFDSTFDEDFRRLAKANVFKPGWEKKTRSMYNLVVLKDMISSLIWYFLTTALIVATSFNGIMNINCLRSEETLAAGKLLGNKLGTEAAKDGKAIKGGATKLKNLNDSITS